MCFHPGCSGTAVGFALQMANLTAGPHVESMLFSRGGEGTEEKGRTGTTPHALCWHVERGDVADAPMEILTQTLMSGKVLVCVSPP